MWSVFLKYCLKVKGKHAVREKKQNYSYRPHTNENEQESKQLVQTRWGISHPQTYLFYLRFLDIYPRPAWRADSPPRELPVCTERLEFVSAVKKSFLLHLWLPLAVFLPGPKTSPSSSVLSHLVSLTSSNSERSQGQSVHTQEPEGLSAASRFAISSICLLCITCMKSNSKHLMGLYTSCGNAHQLLRNFCLRIA